MMIRAAGGPGMVSPIDFGERRKPLPRATWIAVGLVVLAHVGIGAALYYQRFELPAQEVQPEPPTFKVEFHTPKPPEPAKPLPTPVTPPAPNTPLNKTPLPTQPTEVLQAPVTDGPVNPGPITISRPITPDVATGTATEPTPVKTAPAVITSPQWVSRPNANQMMQAYPSRAVDAGLSGSAALSCLVRIDGSLSGCTASSETPPGRGFGRAGVQLSRYFRMSPRTVDGQAVDGARVNFTVRFTIAD